MTCAQEKLSYRNVNSTSDCHHYIQVQQSAERL